MEVEFEDHLIVDVIFHPEVNVQGQSPIKHNDQAYPLKDVKNFKHLNIQIQ